MTFQKDIEQTGLELSIMSDGVIQLKSLFSRLYPTYILIQEVDDIGNFSDPRIIPNPTNDKIFSFITSAIEQDCKISAETTQEFKELEISIQFGNEFPSYTNLFIVSSPETLRQIGSYLCGIQKENVIMDVQNIRSFIGSSSESMNEDN